MALSQEDSAQLAGPLHRSPLSRQVRGIETWLSRRCAAGANHELCSPTLLRGDHTLQCISRVMTAGIAAAGNHADAWRVAAREGCRYRLHRSGPERDAE